MSKLFITGVVEAERLDIRHLPAAAEISVCIVKTANAFCTERKTLQTMITDSPAQGS
jgi:hypothetical protein